MSFNNIGIFPLLLGLAAIAGLLFLLQRLRVRFREQDVVTTLFWKQAMEETRARMLTRRFRHPLSYLLALLIGGLIWFAFAEPRWNRHAEEDFVFLIDGSAGMAQGDRFEATKALLQKDVARLPAENRRVYLSGSDARLILDRGEETSLLLPRLAGLEPEACPSSIERQILAFAKDESAAEKLRLIVVGDAPVSEAAMAMLPDTVSVVRLRPENRPTLKGNSGIASLGVAEAASGAFDQVDVLIETIDATDRNFTMTLGGKALDRVPAKSGNRFLLKDLPARGEVLEIQMTGRDDLPMDDRAKLTLPNRSTVRVRVDANLDPRFHALVRADAALVPSADAPQVVIGGAADGSLPAIELVTGNTISIVHENNLAEADLNEIKARFGATGLDRVGWKAGPDSDEVRGFTLVPRYVEGARRKVQVGVELIGDDYDFMQTSAFPLFMSTAIRWLAEMEPLEPFAMAGEPSVHPGRFAIAGSDFAPPRSGSYQDRYGKNTEVSLAAVSPLPTDALPPVTQSRDSGYWPNLFTWLILIALVLVACEWCLFQKSRIP
jgi:hypothetical protein